MLQKLKTTLSRAGSRIFRGGGRGPILGGGFGLQRGHFSVKMYAKTKELGPVGGVQWHAPLDPPMLSCKSYKHRSLICRRKMLNGFNFRQNNNLHGNGIAN